MNGCNDDAGIGVFQLLFEDGGGRVGGCRALLKAFILLHGLVIQILAVDHKQHFVDGWQVSRQLSGFETGKGFAAAGGVPYIAARRRCAQPSGVGAGHDALQNLFRSDNLIRPHDQQFAIHIEHAVAGEYTEESMLGEKRLGEVDQVRNGLVSGVGPPAGKGKAVGIFLSGFFALLFGKVPAPNGIAVIFGQGAVTDDEQLHILEQAAARPKAVPLIAVDLVEGLANVHPTPFQLDMHQRQAIDQHGHIIAVGIVPHRFILIDDLQAVVVNALLVDQIDVFGRAVVTLEDLDMVFLNAGCLFYDAVIVSCNAGTEKVFPFRIGKGHAVEFFQLAAKVGDKFHLGRDGKVFVGLRLQLLNEGLFQRGFTLIGVVVVTFPHEFGNNRTLFKQGKRFAVRDRMGLAHCASLKVSRRSR